MSLCYVPVTAQGRKQNTRLCPGSFPFVDGGKKKTRTENKERERRSSGRHRVEVNETTVCGGAGKRTPAALSIGRGGGAAQQPE